MDSLLQFLEDYQAKFLALHILGVSLGLGGATISDLLFFKFLKDYRISHKEEEVLHILKSVVLGALGLIILSGLALYLPNANVYNQSALFLVKSIAVGILTINGIALHVHIAPYLIHLNLKKLHKMGRNWHRLAFALGGISAASWYSVFFIAMLKRLMPWGFSTLLLMYLAVLAAGVGVSQVWESHLEKKSALK